MEKVKNLYRGAFNYARSVEIHYAYAYSQAQARIVMCRRLANKHGVHPAVVLGMFKDKPNFEITIEMEIKEDLCQSK